MTYEKSPELVEVHLRPENSDGEYFVQYYRRASTELPHALGIRHTYEPDGQATGFAMQLVWLSDDDMAAIIQAALQ